MSDMAVGFTLKFKHFEMTAICFFHIAYLKIDNTISVLSFEAPHYHFGIDRFLIFHTVSVLSFDKALFHFDIAVISFLELIFIWRFYKDRAVDKSKLLNY